MKVYIATFEDSIVKVFANELDAQAFADNFEQDMKKYTKYPVYVNVDEYEVY